MKSSKAAYSGRLGENLAARYLISQNLNLLVKNFHCCYGEIDLIAMDKEEIVFVEVKTRHKTIKKAENSVSVVKQKRIIKSALMFIDQNPEYELYSLRFDVILIRLRDKFSNTQLIHLKDAFSPAYEESFQ